jgi:hypothetical protein
MPEASVAPVEPVAPEVPEVPEDGGGGVSVAGGAVSCWGGVVPVAEPPVAPDSLLPAPVAVPVPEVVLGVVAVPVPPVSGVVPAPSVAPGVVVAGEPVSVARSLQAASPPAASTPARSRVVVLDSAVMVDPFKV